MFVISFQIWEKTNFVILFEFESNKKYKKGDL